MKRTSSSRMSWSSFRSASVTHSDTDASNYSSSSEKTTTLSSTLYLPCTAHSSNSDLGLFAQELEDENQAWGRPRKPKSRQ